MNGVRQEFLIWPILFDTVIHKLMRYALGGLQDVDVELVNGERLCDLDCTNGLVYLFNAAGHVEGALDKLARTVGSFGMCVARLN